MRLHGLSVKAQTDRGHVITPLPAGAPLLVKGKALELLAALCESIPKTNKHGDELRTRHYNGLHELILDRTGVRWHPSQLSANKKKLINLGVLHVTEEGDLEIVYDAFIHRGTYTARKEAEQDSAPTSEVVVPDIVEPVKRQTAPSPVESPVIKQNAIAPGTQEPLPSSSAASIDSLYHHKYLPAAKKAYSNRTIDRMVGFIEFKQDPEGWIAKVEVKKEVEVVPVAPQITFPDLSVVEPEIVWDEPEIAVNNDEQW